MGNQGHPVCASDTSSLCAVCFSVSSLLIPWLLRPSLDAAAGRTTGRQRFIHSLPRGNVLVHGRCGSSASDADCRCLTLLDACPLAHIVMQARRGAAQLLWPAPAVSSVRHTLPRHVPGMGLFPMMLMMMVISPRLCLGPTVPVSFPSPIPPSHRPIRSCHPAVTADATYT